MGCLLVAGSPILAAQDDDASVDAKAVDEVDPSAYDADQTLALLWAGDYERCRLVAEAKAEVDPWSSTWRELAARAQSATGDYAAARITIEEAVARLPSVARLRVVGAAILRRAGEPERAAELLAELVTRADKASWGFRRPEERVAVGTAKLAQGADVRDVLNGYFRPAKKDDPSHVGSYVAIVRVALDKADDGLAAEEIQKAIEFEPENPDLHYLMARAFAASDSEVTERALARTLELNPRHVDGLLLQVEGMLHSDQGVAADALLAKVLEIEPGRWEAWADRAAIAALRGDKDLCEARRGAALGSWDSNPGVDHRIGVVLSRNYRFAEAAGFQRRALQMHAEFRPARFALAQDLLRLGEEDEGWRLADQVLTEDPYDVVAYNLMTLHDRLQDYQTLRTEHFIVRMEAREAEVYGPLVLELLDRARGVLCGKYHVELERPTLVEVFAEQKDFAIRTFGLPGGAGFLGVCFGDVITMNSPASQGATPSNWRAVLWHEFAHVVTLNKTANRMPRWLSEGISVYEERQENSSWGQSMNRMYRGWVLDGRITPVSGLGGAFLRPQGPMGLQFAYYQSSMVVEYLLERGGMSTLLAVLDDLKAGAAIHQSLAQRVAPAEELDAGFEAWFRDKAMAYAPEVDWDVADAERPEPENLEGLQAWVQTHPNDVPSLLLMAGALIEDGRGAEAVTALEHCLTLEPELTDPDAAYGLLSGVHRGAGDVDSEWGVLQRWVGLDSGALLPRQRMMELADETGSVDRETEAVHHALALQPLLPALHRLRRHAAEGRADHVEALAAGQALLALDPVDPADVHYHRAMAAEALQRWPLARREVLRALEEAPRFRAAHSLLLRVVRALAAAEDDS